jgi:phage portal protein BeeE
VKVFSQGRFQYQRLTKGRPGDLWGDDSLGVLEKPWPGGTTSDLLATMLLDADLGGNAYIGKIGRQLVRLRPDWVEVILGERIGGIGPLEKVGYLYWHGGKGPGGDDPVPFLASEVSHFMPMPDPLYGYRGMSWLTPVIREIQSDGAATSHKLKFFENAATPNLSVSLPKEITPQQFDEFVELMDSKHSGFQNAYKTLYTGGGADVTVIGANMQQLDFKVTQGAGETRIALAAGIHPAVAGLSEGMQGASLNAGNFSAARRQTADIEFAHLWGNVASSLEVIIPPPSGSRLTIDKRDIPFLREDEKDAAEIEQIKAGTIANLVKEGFTSESAVAAVDGQDMTLLVHSGLVSVQLQAPGSQMTPDMPAGDMPVPAA